MKEINFINICRDIKKANTSKDLAKASHDFFNWKTKYGVAKESSDYIFANRLLKEARERVYKKVYAPSLKNEEKQDIALEVAETVATSRGFWTFIGEGFEFIAKVFMTGLRAIFKIFSD